MLNVVIGRWMIGMLIFIGLSLGAIAWLHHSGNLTIHQVHLYGPLKYAVQGDLEQIISQTVDGNLLTQDLQLLERRLQEYPWVNRARIRRDWPNALRVQVEEHIPMANWGDGGFLSQTGEQFTPREPVTLDLISISGMPGRGEALVQLTYQLRELLRPHGLELTRLRENRHRLLTLTVDPDLTLELGRVRPIQRLARWLRYRQAFERQAKQRATVIDLRYPNGFAVRTAAR